MATHSEITATWRHRILSGAVGVGDKLPSTRELAAEHGVTVGTIARVVRDLQAAGLVVARAGKGVWVTGAERTPGVDAEANAVGVSASIVDDVPDWARPWASLWPSALLRVSIAADGVHQLVAPAVAATPELLAEQVIKGGAARLVTVSTATVTETVKAETAGDDLPIPPQGWGSCVLIATRVHTAPGGLACCLERVVTRCGVEVPLS